MLDDISADLAAQKPSSVGNSSLFNPSTGAPSQAARFVPMRPVPDPSVDLVKAPARLSRRRKCW